MYLLEPQPNNPEITTIEYWRGAVQLYPHLSQAALQLFSISTGGVDVERSFSKLRKFSTQPGHLCQLKVYICK